MIAASDDLDDLVIRVEEAFLDDPSLTLTDLEASLRFGVDEITCAAVFGALIAAGIVAKSSEGGYASWFPRLAGTPFGPVPHRVVPELSGPRPAEWLLPGQPA